MIFPARAKLVHNHRIHIVYNKKINNNDDNDDADDDDNDDNDHNNNNNNQKILYANIFYRIVKHCHSIGGSSVKVIPTLTGKLLEGIFGSLISKLTSTT